MPRQTIAFPPVPVLAQVVPPGCRKAQAMGLVRREGLAVRELAEDEAPVCLSLATAATRGARNYGEGLVPEAPLSWVRHDGERYWRPMVGPRHDRPLTLDGIEDAMGLVRRGGAGHWPDWPWPMDMKVFASNKLPLQEEATLVARRVETDLAASHAEVARHWEACFALIDGVLHRACDEPVIEIMARDVSKGQVSSVEAMIRAGHDEASRERGRQDCVQVFRADMAEEAEAYMERVARWFRAPLGTRKRPWADGAALSRDDREAAPVESALRFLDRTGGLVGRCQRALVEAWLDLRDATAWRTRSSGKGHELIHGIFKVYDLGRQETDKSVRLHALVELARYGDLFDFGGEDEVDQGDREALAALG